MTILYDKMPTLRRIHKIVKYDVNQAKKISSRRTRPASLPAWSMLYANPSSMPPHMTIIVKYDVNQPNKTTLYTWTDVQEELDLPAWSMLYANPAQDT